MYYLYIVNTTAIIIITSDVRFLVSSAENENRFERRGEEGGNERLNATRRSSHVSMIVWAFFRIFSPPTPRPPPAPCPSTLGPSGVLACSWSECPQRRFLNVSNDRSLCRRKNELKQLNSDVYTFFFLIINSSSFS